jgi:hypothetical protein
LLQALRVIRLTLSLYVDHTRVTDTRHRFDRLLINDMAHVLNISASRIKISEFIFPGQDFSQTKSALSESNVDTTFVTIEIVPLEANVAAYDAVIDLLDFANESGDFEVFDDLNTKDAPTWLHSDDGDDLVWNTMSVPTASNQPVDTQETVDSGRFSPNSAELLETETAPSCRSTEDVVVGGLQVVQTASDIVLDINPLYRPTDSANSDKEDDSNDLSSHSENQETSEGSIDEEHEFNDQQGDLPADLVMLPVPAPMELTSIEIMSRLRYMAVVGSTLLQRSAVCVLLESIHAESEDYHNEEIPGEPLQRSETQT